MGEDNVTAARVCETVGSPQLLNHSAVAASQQALASRWLLLLKYGNSGNRVHILPLTYFMGHLWGAGIQTFLSRLNIHHVGKFRKYRLMHVG